MKRQLLTAVIAMMAAAVCAQQDNVFTVDAQLRTRGEHNNGAIIPISEGEQSANFINERARLSFGFRRDNLQLKASVQHTGLWGQDGMKDANGRATMNEAWAKMTFGDAFFAKLGRQQLSYDDERILGASDWNVNGNWHDALKLGYEDLHNQVHVIVAMNQTAENNRGDYYNGPMPYKNMQALWYHYQSQMLPLGFSVLAMNIGRELGATGHGRTWYMQTVGADFSFQPLNWGVHAAGYYQRGTNTDGRDVQAWMATGRIDYNVAPVLGLYVGFDYLSGNKGIEKVGAFNALYGTHHKFYGAMDIFPGQAYCGLMDFQGGVRSRISNAVSLRADYHYFMAAEDVRGYERPLGHEVDLQFTARLMKDVTLTGGYSFLLSEPAMDYVKGGDHEAWQDWAWLQLNISPRIFSAKW
jgi:hypothetical protein